MHEQAVNYGLCHSICGCVANPNAVKALKGKPVWTAHGKKDKSIPFEETEKLVTILGGQSDNVHFSIYEDKGHEICSLAYEDENMYKWLLERRL